MGGLICTHCERVATRQVAGVGFCTRHIEEAFKAAALEDLRIYAKGAYERFRSDRRQAIKRHRTHRKGTI
jgi:hypothetical protein